MRMFCHATRTLRARVALMFNVDDTVDALLPPALRCRHYAAADARYFDAERYAMMLILLSLMLMRFSLPCRADYAAILYQLLMLPLRRLH